MKRFALKKPWRIPRHNKRYLDYTNNYICIIEVILHQLFTLFDFKVAVVFVVTFIILLPHFLLICFYILVTLSIILPYYAKCKKNIKN